MKKLILFTLLVSVATLAGFWASRKMCMSMWAGSLNPTARWYESLSLSAGQKETLKNTEAGFRDQADKLCMRICAERMEIVKLMRQAPVDQEALFRKIEAAGALQTDLEKMISSHILEVSRALTPAQAAAYMGRIQGELEKTMRQCGYKG